MALVINNPGDTRADNSGIGMILGVIIALLAIALLAVYAFPALRRQVNDSATPNNASINIQVPNPTNNNAGSGVPSPTPGTNQ